MERVIQPHIIDGVAIRRLGMTIAPERYYSGIQMLLINHLSNL
jgi:hypothetical protein